jgi:hypothetical protein
MSYKFYKSRPDLFRVILDSVVLENQRYQEKLNRSRKSGPMTGTTAPPTSRPVPTQ